MIDDSEDEMQTLKIDHQTIELDDDGFVIHPEQWSLEVAGALAEREGIDELTDEHVEVIAFVRKYFEQFGVAPMVHYVAKGCGKTYRQLHGLFRKQPGKRAAKLAGVPKVAGCV